MPFLHKNLQLLVINASAAVTLLEQRPDKKFSAAKTASLPGTKHSGETTKYMSPLQVFLQEKRKAVDNHRRRVSQLRANSRGAGETHRHFAGSFTIVLSVLTYTA